MHDIHTHLYWQFYDVDRDTVIARARAAGVEKLLVIGCTVEESKQAIALTEQYPDVYAAIGVHPQEFSDESRISNLESWIDKLRVLVKYEKVIAIGECGLEYYSHDPKQVVTDEQKQWQKKAFLAQIELAEEFGLPLIIHARPSSGTMDSYEDVYFILKSKIKNLKSIVLHCYQGDTEVTKKFLLLPNVFFSFTGNITYPVKKAMAGTKDDLSETVKLIPLNRIFTETDCPFLAPQSHRGERNEPAFVMEVVTKIAELHTVSVTEVTRVTEENFQNVFIRVSL